MLDWCVCVNRSLADGMVTEEREEEVKVKCADFLWKSKYLMAN